MLTARALDVHVFVVTAPPGKSAGGRTATQTEIAGHGRASTETRTSLLNGTGLELNHQSHRFLPKSTEVASDSDALTRLEVRRLRSVIWSKVAEQPATSCLFRNEHSVSVGHSLPKHLDLIPGAVCDHSMAALQA
jgi:hypothetical protein